MASLEKNYRGSLIFLLEVASYLEVGAQDELRILTGVLKLWTAKECVKLVEEGVESFGGIGYMENSGIPQILRDSQVFLKCTNYL